VASHPPKGPVGHVSRPALVRVNASYCRISTRCASCSRSADAAFSTVTPTALALQGYAELARLNESGLTAITGFDVTLIEEARTVAAALREQSASALTRTNPDAQRRVLGLRNRLLTMLIDRVRRARRTAQYVFRDHPEVIRKFSSAYERRQRATRRRNAKEAEEGKEEKKDGEPTVAVV
jgi:hypothetical protein